MSTGKTVLESKTFAKQARPMIRELLLHYCLYTESDRFLLNAPTVLLQIVVQSGRVCKMGFGT